MATVLLSAHEAYANAGIPSFFPLALFATALVMPLAVIPTIVFILVELRVLKRPFKRKLPVSANGVEQKKNITGPVVWAKIITNLILAAYVNLLTPLRIKGSSQGTPDVVH